MTKFKATFTNSPDLKLITALQKEFDLCYEHNKEYFDSFEDSIDVCFNGTNISMIKMLGNFTPEKNMEHQTKIRGLVQGILQREPKI